MISQRQLIIGIVAAMFFLCCAKKSDVLTEEEIKTYCSVCPVFAQILKSDEETVIEIERQSSSLEEISVRIESYIKGRQDFPDINNRMKALGMSFEQFMRTHIKIMYAYEYYRLFGDQQPRFVDSVVKDWSKDERRESEKQFLEKIKNIPKQNVELLKKYYDVITDLWNQLKE